MIEIKSPCFSVNYTNYDAMRLYGCGFAVLAIFLFQGGARAQDMIQTLKQELAEAKQQHQDATSQVSTNFFSQVDAAMADPDSAIALYKLAGGALPDPAPVLTENVDESASEKDARLAVDQANLSHLAIVVQLQCGMLHYAALFVVDPKRAGLHDDWVDWLKKAAQIYPQLGIPPPSRPLPKDQQQSEWDHKKKKEDGGGGGGGAPATPPAPAPNPLDPKQISLRDAAITKFLGFKALGDKEQGGWAVKDLPQLYRTNVLDPSRVKPTEDTLSFWTAYIAMLNADEPNNDKWNQEVYPPLAFDRATDDYAISPGTEKLEALINIIKAFPTSPHSEEWADRVNQLIDKYSASHGGSTTTTSGNDSGNGTATPTTDPNVSVTTQQQGDMTIVTTHTNAAPSAPTTP
jgi:hypothetical protein